MLLALAFDVQPLVFLLTHFFVFCSLYSMYNILKKKNVEHILFRKFFFEKFLGKINPIKIYFYLLLTYMIIIKQSFDLYLSVMQHASVLMQIF